MTDRRSSDDGWGGGECPAGFARRSFLRGSVAAGLVGAAGVGNLMGSDAAVAAAPGAGSPAAVPFYGNHQSGILTHPQTAGTFASFDVTAATRTELADLFRTLTARARLLTAGGTPPKAPPSSPPPDDGMLGPEVVPDGLTITVAVGASLFDGRYGLGARKPVQLVTMKPFLHDNLDAAQSHGDILIQLCASHRDTTVHALLDILAHTSGAMKPRWQLNGMRHQPRPVGTARDWFGFKDGITQPDTTNAAQMNEAVWVQPHTAEPAWAAGGSYQAVRIIHFDVQQWQRVPLAQQERIMGRRKASGAPLYVLDENAPDTIDPVYTNDPQGLITPLNSHIRLANPQTPETASTSTILRRSYDFDRTINVNGGPDLGHAFCCFQRELNTYIAMQTRLEGEALAPFISPQGGGYFFAVPGVRNSQDYYARGLLA